ncbi:MAG: hypothetical protein ACVCEJ_00420 [Candidatus Izemoplasmataceae bacterium]
MESQALVSYIEKIRYGRNISQEQMLNGIISIRQYRRYLYGKVEIPFGVFAQLAMRLNVSPKNLILEFEEEKNKEKRLIIEYYNAVGSYDEKKIDELYHKIDKDNIIDSEQLVFFNSANIIHLYNQGKLSKKEVADTHKDLVGYPKILSNKILTDNEMYLLGTISQYDPETKQVIMEKFETIFHTDELVVSGDNIVTYTQVLFWLAKYTGSLKQYNKTIEYSNMGIKYNTQFKSRYLMSYFYYFKSLSHYRIGNQIKYEKALYKTILYLELESSQSRTEHFYETIKKDLNIDPLTFVRDYINKNKLK